MLKRITAALLISIATIALAPAQAGEMDTANQLVSEGKYQQAFDLLAPLEFDLSGDESFDLLFGFTALETGNTSIASLAFERVLAINPDSNTARFHLARAYYVLSDFDGARREFELLLSLNPTAGIRETVGQYLDAIAARRPGAKTNYSSYLAIGLGSDSNVTGATAENSVFFPGLGQDLLLSDGETEEEDGYSNFSTGLNIVHKLSDANSLYVGGDLDFRNHSDRDDLDYGIASVRGGYQHAFGNQSVRYGLTSGYMELDGESYQQNQAIDVEWRNTVEQRTQFGIVGKFASFRHDSEANEVSDYDDTSIDFSVLRVLGEQGSDIISFSLTAGVENDINNRADGNLDYLRLGFTGQMEFANGNSGFLLISLRAKQYDRENDLFLKKRDDSQISLVTGVVFKVSKTVSIRPIASWSETDSNLELYNNSRSDISVTLRMDFI